jgi:hypothetical protein
MSSALNNPAISTLRMVLPSGDNSNLMRFLKVESHAKLLPLLAASNALLT